MGMLYTSPYFVKLNSYLGRLILGTLKSNCPIYMRLTKLEMQDVVSLQMGWWTRSRRRRRRRRWLSRMGTLAMGSRLLGWGGAGRRKATSIRFYYLNPFESDHPVQVVNKRSDRLRHDTVCKVLAVHLLYF